MEPLTPLLDEEARREFAETLDRNFCVSAGAGVGKTTAITRRIANLALHRHEQPDLLRRLVVVTYGKLAAEELRVRTRDLILEQLDSSAYGRQTLLAELRGAFFGTIHSFCLKLIADEGRFLGLPENAALLENRDEPALWERFCQCDALSDLELPPAVLDAVSRHLTFDQLLSLARQFPAGAAVPPFDASTPPPTLDLSAALGFVGKRGMEKTAEHQERLRRWQREFEGGAPFLTLPDFKGGASGFLDELRAALLPYVRWLNAAAGSLSASIAAAYQAFRLEQGLMTFPDQIVWCRKLIGDPAVLRRLRERRYIVILDEAQDTDAEMFAILTEITRPVEAPTGAWPEDVEAEGPEPGRFCFVGDDQQAIYGERADLRVYRQYVDAYRESRGGSRLEFSVTMRCPRRVIEAVNGIFAGRRLPQAHAEFRALDPRPDCPTGAAWRMELSALPDSDSRLKKDERLYREIVRVADFVNQRGLSGLGITRWSELAVVAPRVSWLEQAARVFESHGLPTVLMSQRAIARDQPRLSWPAALLHTVLHPWDRFELIGVLREIFGVSDVELARLHRAGGLAFWPDLPGPRSGRLAKALALLHELRRALPGEPAAPRVDDQATLSRYVDFVLERTALASRLEAIGEPANCLRPLRAQAFQAECDGLTLRDWVRSLVNALEDAAPPPAGAANAIQFLTPLKAKGLEWPAVIALGAGCAITDRRRTYPCVEVRDRVTHVHFSGLTLDDDANDASQGAREEELQRMLYVTLTRARRLLIVPDGAKLYDGRTPNFQQLARWMELDLPTLFTDADLAPPPAPPPVVSENRAAPFVENKRRMAQAKVISARIPRRVLPSGLVHGVEAAAAVEDRAPAFVFEEIAGGVDYGNWWHGVLEHYPWASSDDDRAEYVAHEIARLPAAARWASRAVDEITRFAESEPHAAFLEHGRVFLPEAPFSHPASDEEWIEGIMDLVIVTRPANELWVVDWKTDRRQSTDASEDAFLKRLAEKYAPQLRAYAAVFARGFGRPVSRLYLYSTPLARAVAVDGTD